MNNINLYKDSETGNIYYYNGTKLVLYKKAPDLRIGNKGDADIEKKEEEERQKQIEKEKSEENKDGESEENSYGETEEEKAERLQRIKDALSNSEEMQKAKDEVEIPVNRERDAKRQKSAKDETSKASSSIQRFEHSLNKFIRDQIEPIRKGTWKVANSRYEGSGIMRKGRQRVRQENIPLINVYFDQSGSWDESDIKVGMEAIGILNNYVKKHQITINIYYFSNDIYTNAREARADGGTGAGKKLIEHIQETRPNNVIVMTDSDFDSWGEINYAPNISVSGAVWLLFRNGERSKSLIEHLKGRKQTSVYDI